MSTVIKGMVPPSARRFCYRGRLAAGWTVYFAGWVIWIASLWLPADHLVHGAQQPMRTISFICLMALGSVAAIATFRLSLGLLLPLYFIGLIGGIAWPIWRCRQPIGLLCRMASLGMLEMTYAVIGYLAGYRNGGFYLGFPMLALGSTLICIGVWLIPPRQKCGKSTGEDRKQSTASNADPDSGTRGT